MPSRLEPYSPSAEDPWDAAKAAHLLRRAGFGPLPSEIARVVEAGPDRAVESLFAFPSAPPPPAAFAEIAPAEARVDEIIREAVRTRTRPKDSPELRATLQEANRAHGRGVAALTAWWLDRMAQSRAPLQEKLTLFWHGHFTTSFGDVHDAIATRRGTSPGCWTGSPETRRCCGT